MNKIEAIIDHHLYSGCTNPACNPGPGVDDIPRPFARHLAAEIIAATSQDAPWVAFPGKVDVCRDCGTDWAPVRRGECSCCGSDAGPLPTTDEGRAHE